MEMVIMGRYCCFLVALLLQMVLLNAGLCSCQASPIEQSQPHHREIHHRFPDTFEGFVEEPVFQGKVYVYEVGRNNPYSVVLIHGIGSGAARNWENVIHTLARQYHVVVFDLPGFGRSDKENALYSPANYAALVKWVVEKRVQGPFTLVGHSMGGAIALHFAAIYPRHLQHLILIDVAGVLHRTVVSELSRKIKKNIPFGELLSKPLDIVDRCAKIAMAAIEYGGLPEDLDSILASARLRQRILKGNPDIIAGLAVANEDFSRRVEYIGQPVTIIWGAQDTVAPIRTGKALVARLPNARLIEMKGLGHSPMLEDPQRFNKLLMQNISAPTDRSVPLKIVGSKRVGRFEQKNDLTITGAYDRVKINNCHNIKLEKVTARSLLITKSEANIENSWIAGSKVALTATDSWITLTAVTLEGEVAIVAERSHLDLAGVVLKSKEIMVKSQEKSALVFSVSKAVTGGKTQYLHGIHKLTPIEGGS